MPDANVTVQSTRRRRPATAAAIFAPSRITSKYRCVPVHLLGVEEDEQPLPKPQTVVPRPKSAAPIDRGPGRSALAPKLELFPPSPLHYAAGKLYDRKEQTYYELKGMLDGSLAAAAVASVRARIEAREAAKAQVAAAAAAAAAAAEAAPAAAGGKPAPKKGKPTPDEIAAEAAAAEAAAVAAKAKAEAEAEAEAVQAAEDARQLAAANVDWLSRLEEKALPFEWTPLMFAASHGDAENVRILITAGANVNVKDACGSTPLHKAAADGKGDGPKKLQLLKGAGADLRQVDRQGMSPLHIAASNERLENITMLMSLGASQWAKNGPLLDGETPLEMATQTGLHETVRVLRATEARRKGWASGHSVLIPAQTPSWEPEAFTAKRMNAKGTWDSIAFARYVPPPIPKRYTRHSSRPIGAFL